MSLRVLDATSRANVRAATNQVAQLDALLAEIPGDVTVRFYNAAGTLVQTVTHGAAVLDSNNPRGFTWGPIAANTVNVAGATIAYATFGVSGGLEVFRLDAADLDLNSLLTKAGRRINLADAVLDKLTITALASLPVDGLPAWLSGVGLHEWVTISGTGGAGGAQVDAFSGFVALPDGRLICDLAGGHNDSDDNRTTEIDLTDNAPAWVELLPTSLLADRRIDNPYYLDGKPTSRHNYTNLFYVPSMDRVFHVGCKGAYGNGNDYPPVDAYHVTGNAHDADNTYTDCPNGGRGVVFDGAHIWVILSTGIDRFNPATDTWDTPISTRATNKPETPFAYDSSRSELFGLQYVGGAAVASRIPIGGSTEVQVAINSSAALTQWLADTPVDPSMEYDPENDRFLFYDGRGSSAGRVFSITAGGDTRDMTILSISGTTPGASVSAGIQCRFRYVAALKGFVVLPQRTDNLSFFRVA